jgi:hypothetical protein
MEKGWRFVVHFHRDHQILSSHVWMNLFGSKALQYLDAPMDSNGHS